MKGNPLTLMGKMPQVGDKAPDFVVVTNDLKEIRLSDFAGKATLLFRCRRWTPRSARWRLTSSTRKPPRWVTSHRRGDQHGPALRPETLVWLRACRAIKTLSDHRQASFGQAYGVLIKELRLLARAVFAIDRSGTIRHVELVREVTNEPNYDAALKAVTEAANR